MPHPTIPRRFPFGRKLLAFAVFATIVALATASPLHAGIGDTISLPSPMFKGTPSGISLTIASHWVDTPGTLPLQFHASFLAGAKSADHTLRIEIKQTYDFGETSHTTTGYLELPAGAATADAVIPIPQLTPLEITHFRLRVWQDGCACNDLAFNGSLCPRTATGGMRSAPVSTSATQFGFRTLAYVSASAPTRVELGTSRPAGSFKDQPEMDTAAAFMRTFLQLNGRLPSPADTPTVLNAAIDNIPEAMLLRADELPTEWAQLVGLDFIGIPIADAQALAKSDSVRWRSLADWTSAGGCLVLITRGGEKMPGDDELRQLFGGPLAPSRLLTVRAIDQLERSPQFSTSGDSPNTSPFVRHEYGKGEVLVTSDEKLARPDDQVSIHGNNVREWERARQLVHANRTPLVADFANRESGFDLLGDPDASQFGIPGVGLPPITAFYFLITLFALVIGPLNFMFLWRWRRQYLMLLTVPLAALLCTLGLVAYVLVMDGLSTRIRVRSLTFLSKQSGRATCWSRQAYFAAMSPLRGLTFPPEAAVFAITEDGASNNRFGRYGYDLDHHQTASEWGEHQRFVSGYLPSRTISQFVTLTTQAAAQKLDLSVSPDRVCVVGNKLDVPIQRLLVLDGKGGFFFTDHAIAAGESADLPALADSKAALTQLDDMLRARMPSGIPIVGPDHLNSGGDSRQNVDQLAIFLMWLKTSINNSPPQFVALVERPIIPVPHGLAGLHEEASVHIVTGDWSP